MKIEQFDCPVHNIPVKKNEKFVKDTIDKYSCPKCSFSVYLEKSMTNIPKKDTSE
jgi:hypothetical protein